MANNKIRKMKQKRKPLEENMFWKLPKRINKKIIKAKGKPLVPKGFFAVKPIPNNSRTISKRTSQRNNLWGLYGAVPSRPVKSRVNEKMKLFTPVKMPPVSYLAKESINQKRKLNEWGDADLDGSPNKFDCNPRNPAEDGIFARALGKLTGGKYGQSAEEYAAEKQEKKLSKYSIAAIGLEKEEREASAARREFGNLAKQRITELSKGEGIKLDSEQVKKVGAGARELIREEEEAAIKKYGTKAPSRTKVVTEFVKERRRELIEAGKSPMSKRISELNREIADLQSKGKATFKLREKRDRLKKEIEQKRKRVVGGILSAVTPLGAVPEVRRLAQAKLPSETKKGGGRGRPKGPSGKYVVDGVPVSEAEFQQVRSVEIKKKSYGNGKDI